VVVSVRLNMCSYARYADSQNRLEDLYSLVKFLRVEPSAKGGLPSGKPKAEIDDSSARDQKYGMCWF
jgi:hypothetical protein